MPPPSVNHYIAINSELDILIQSRTSNGSSEAKKNRGPSHTLLLDCNGYSDVSAFRGCNDDSGYSSFWDSAAIGV